MMKLRWTIVKSAFHQLSLTGTPWLPSFPGASSWSGDDHGDEDDDVDVNDDDDNDNDNDNDNYDYDDDDQLLLLESSTI